VVLTGGVSISSQLVLVLCAAAAASLLTRSTAAWARPGTRSRRAG
jgi:ribose/xylose/arabinose/galactoside ABC-type transport system permease subunit